MPRHPHLVEVKSGRSVAEARVRLEELLLEKGIGLFAVFDHGMNAAEAGLDMPASVVVVFGKAEAGTPLMLAAPDLALDLPLRMLLRQGENDGSLVVYHDLRSLAGEYGLADPALLQRVEKLAGLLDALARALA